MKTLQDIRTLHARPGRRARRAAAWPTRSTWRCSTAQHAESPRLHPLLAGRAPQHERHRLLGHRRAGGPHRGRHQTHARGLGRRDAAQPCAAGGGRSLRHAGRALPRPHRPGPGPGARHRPADHARAAPQPHRKRRRLPARRGRTAAPAGPVAARPARGRQPGRRHQRADLAARLQPVLGPAGGRARSAVSPSPRTSHRACCCRRWTCTAAISSHRPSWRNPT